ncbi:MAG: hypothetical protein BWX61_01065 [Bacteroidetes bacterium ADurb.Bin035]|nr:MAG: hypothetical protein BWX61_01065 [Bacteroidetes bacterium ADurb.Bin035]
MNELFDELERAIAIDYSKALYSCEQIVDSLDLEYTVLNDKFRVKFNNMLDDWFKLTNKKFLITNFYKILTTENACYYLLTKSYELHIGKSDEDLFIEKISADIISTEDKINIMENFENVLEKFKNDVILEYDLSNRKYLQHIITVFSSSSSNSSKV